MPKDFGNMSTSVGDLVRRMRDQLRARSTSAMADFVAAFRSADRDGSGTLDSRQLDATLRSCSLFIGMYDVSALMRKYSGSALFIC